MDPTEKRLSASLAAASRAYKAQAAEEMRALGVHAGQNFLLEALRADGAMTTGDLARRLHVEVPTATRMTQRMEATGLVSRSADPADRRRVLVDLTEHGLEVAARLPRLLDAVSRRALAGLSKTEREALVASLDRVAANLGWGDGRD